MKNADEKAMRLSRNPVDWLVLADLFEERGDIEESVRWRRLGQRSQILLPILVDLAWRTGTTDEHWYPLEPGSIAWLIRKPKRIEVDVRQVKNYGVGSYWASHHKVYLIPDYFMALRRPLESINLANPNANEWRYIFRKLRDITDRIAPENKV